MVLGEVEETITIVEVNEDVQEQVIRVIIYPTTKKNQDAHITLTIISLDCKAKL